MLRTKCFAWSFSQFWNTKIPSLPNKTFPHLSDSPWLCHAFALESYLRQEMWLGSPLSPTTSHHKIESMNLIQWGCLWPFIESCREGFFRQNQSIDEDNSGSLSETRVANWLRSAPKTPDQSISSGLEGDFWCQTFFLIFVYNAQKKLLRTKFVAWDFSQFWNTNIPSLPNKTLSHTCRTHCSYAMHYTSAKNVAR